jgi:hypothetical protein
MFSCPLSQYGYVRVVAARDDCQKGKSMIAGAGVSSRRYRWKKQGRSNTTRSVSGSIIPSLSSQEAWDVFGA